MRPEDKGLENKK